MAEVGRSGVWRAEGVGGEIKGLLVGEIVRGEVGREVVFGGRAE